MKLVRCLPPKISATLFLLAAVIATAAHGAGESLDTALDLREQALASDRAWQLVESLTTEVGPRLAGTSSDEKAVSWAKAELEKAGFDKVWLEPVEFPVWQRLRESARVVAPYPQPLQIAALGYSGSTPGEITAEVIGFATLEALTAASADQVKGKIVFINHAMQRSRDGRGYGEVVPVRYAAGKVAKEKGAVAALIRSVGTDSHRFPHVGMTLRSDRPFPAAALSAPDADQLQRILQRKAVVTLALDIQVSETDGGKSYNVIGQINGRSKPEELILIGAHLDSWDLGTGAIDDGAGVAITLAAAELIANLPQRPRRSIRVVFFANEEQGVWGGKAYAERHADELDKHILASESDFGAGPVWRFDTQSLPLMEAAMQLLSPLNIERGAAPRGGGPDIGPMQKKGVAVFRLNQDGTDYFDYHHTADDTLDKINPEILKQNVAAWTLVTYLAAEL